MISSGRLEYIDGLRGIAALMVVVQHAGQVAHQKGSALFDPLLDTVNLGRFGVVLFFLISGFVIPFSFRGERPLRDFAVTRFFRLYPAYWLSVLVVTGIVTASGAHIGAATFAANLTMVQGTFGFDHIGFGYWTLNLEIVFYVTCAVLFARHKLGDVNLIGTLVLAGLGIALSPYAIRAVTGTDGFATEFPFYLAMFLTGLLLRRACVDGCAAARAWLRGIVPLVLVTGTALGGWYFPVFMNGQPFFAALPMGLGMSLPLALFVAVLAVRPVPPRSLLWLGTISYSLYLFQDAGLHGMAGLVDPGAWPVSYALGVSTISIAIAAAVHRIVEDPMIALGRRFTTGKTTSNGGAVTA